MRHLLDVVDLSIGDIDELIETAEDISRNPSKYSEACKGKKLATLFFEPSTRTRLSFEAAMLELGGSVLGFSEATSSSAAKGESIRDTVKVVSNYADIIAMRHPIEGAAAVATVSSDIPIVNAGDGGHCHPTQTLADLLTIHRECGRLDNLTIGLCGDLKYGRTVHSLINAMSRYENNEFILISPRELVLPEYMIKFMEEKKINYRVTSDMEEFMPFLDVLYMTRVQKERFDDVEEYERVKDCYVLDNAKLRAAKQSMRILHPLPRVGEIACEVDSDPRAAYFRQTLNGKLMRMALILKLLASRNEITGKKTHITDKTLECPNPKCVTHYERELEPEFIQNEKGEYRCAFCDCIVKKRKPK